MTNIAQILSIVAGLTIFVNIITEVFKKMFDLKSSKNINIFVTMLSVVLTITSMLAYCDIHNIYITWYIAIAFVVLGFMVAYSAMFGFDKLLKYFEKE